MTGEGSGGSDSSPVKVTEGDAFRIRVHHIDVKAYKKLLVMRILHVCCQTLNSIFNLLGPSQFFNGRRDI